MHYGEEGRRKTANSKHHYHKFGNLIRGFKPTAPNQLWVSDITYIDTEDGTCYLSIITDAFLIKYWDGVWEKRWRLNTRFGH